MWELYEIMKSKCNAGDSLLLSTGKEEGEGRQPVAPTGTLTLAFPAGERIVLGCDSAVVRQDQTRNPYAPLFGYLSKGPLKRYPSYQNIKIGQASPGTPKAQGHSHSEVFTLRPLRVCARNIFSFPV